MYNDYKVLPIAPAVFKVLAWIGVFLGLISCIIVLAGGGMPETPRWMGLITLLVGVVYFFFFMVAAEGIKLLLDMNAKIK